MSLTIPIETLRRHIHITAEDFETLFGPGSKAYLCKGTESTGTIRMQRAADCRRSQGAF